MGNKILLHITIIVILSAGLLSCIGTKPKIEIEPDKKLNIKVVDDAGNILSGAQVQMSKGNNELLTQTKETNLDGFLTFEEIFKLPVTLNASYTEGYVPKTVTITRRDFPPNKRTIEKNIVLERRKTTIYGRVIDRATGEPIKEIITIKTYPFELIEQTEVDGSYRISTTEFSEGDIITVYAEKIGMYEKNSVQVTILNYWGENRVPEISLKAIPQTETDIMTSDSTETYETGGGVLIDF